MDARSALQLEARREPNYIQAFVVNMSLRTVIFTPLVLRYPQTEQRKDLAEQDTPLEAPSSAERRPSAPNSHLHTPAMPRNPDTHAY